MSIYYLKYNNKYIVIIVNSKSQYKLWAIEKEIKLELFSIYIYKSNKLAKQIKQEVIIKLIKIQLGVCLFKKL